MDSVFGPGHLYEFMQEGKFIAPIIAHVYEGFTPDADSVWVGEARCIAELSPWSCPFIAEEYTKEKAEEVFKVRADVDDWIMRLSGKTLVCNCERHADECWAGLVRNEFVDLFDGCTVDWNSFVDEEMDNDEGLTEDDSITGSRSRDEIGWISEDVSSVPRNVPWPEAWFELVKNVRGLRRPTFWELFSGAAAMTLAFEEAEVSCAPPVDAADNADFNLLNPLSWRC